MTVSLPRHGKTSPLPPLILDLAPGKPGFRPIGPATKEIDASGVEETDGDLTELALWILCDAFPHLLNEGPAFAKLTRSDSLCIEFTLLDNDERRAVERDKGACLPSPPASPTTRQSFSPTTRKNEMREAIMVLSSTFPELSRKESRKLARSFLTDPIGQSRLINWQPSQFLSSHLSREECEEDFWAYRQLSLVPSLARDDENSDKKDKGWKLFPCLSSSGGRSGVLDRIEARRKAWGWVCVR